MEDNKIQQVEHFKFEPIKGYPMLHWKGKRPFESTFYYPAQLKEVYGKPDETGWMNKIFWGDNLQVMSHLLKEFRGKIKLIYIDPPFDSKADYKKRIQVRGNSTVSHNSLFEEKQYTDIWSNDEYLQFLYERLILMRELLAEDGSIFVHTDWHKSHHIRCLLDEVFGDSGDEMKKAGFKGEIIWYFSLIGGNAKKFEKNHENIYWYTKSSEYIFNKDDVRQPYSKEFLEQCKRDEEGRLYYTRGMGRDGEKLNRKHISYIHPLGKAPSDVWTDIKNYSPTGKERLGYPTQKPEALIERIIKAASNPGDIVFDCFMGSGTTQAVAMKLGRRFIGSDINLGAVQTTTKRLLNILREDPDLKTGFEVYNVNNYEFFRNPVQAKELLIEALEIQPLPNNSLYDGELDGRMVKIMPTNRIATKADLGELIQNFDYRLFEKRREERPNQPVEKLLLVCMGHEPDLKSFLQKQVPYKLDIEIVDILRDRQDLQFKREAEADIVIENGKLIIKSFYPMNLLQKLSLMQENVEDWRELVDSIMIDWNYDGSVLEPNIIDVPDKNELVKGIYDVPKNAGTIKVKITDLLSESLEVEIENV
ncbi:site-specific DNA-methyltransferase [Anoxybacillus flavithermus]|uniref:Adenine specific DNA methylase Mod n=1 Tax=Anoxybacillus flavithermus (strain DSM 21510 / WK1) TaxID=491915 RepID=B7GHX5_ANOFW|nr:site-specific DNA-methyltransferase [Anoxybacillus flavithermus]ACJ33550.1 Adenine specific DNA methylase Mod [Anoxybacillus flavithermus WK1]